ncbi:multifunctional oxoglutarate decarboxylase/oxoglutarate dehydrogenase thiamine pyrophosphate-binding subunit/dihydrolipoyllysine-residue succinyltransferase subunit [Corynebacterium tuscaniense]|uniref:Multifunctional oxoglutarate decarboxylase/oxoglutarate dehydrogenase thiamine pyrophosphate-binding subunit/dihydrolipoyllysine-residue succinyltransferase subunit n=1 Tax=Corynebacterium tuscaniense TaxID=302449 RepID=A0A2N6T7X7_9CORY|nr:multifunctional oxoglutarate decarboxylase/oxoglutarate dehydrogenase thiamine pyrophosphate-binding subunit/dihydrolipoyllysine-residue succinyltransferase subunit [Corynebacterium tuscaniense]PMC65436.1 multifunctional oxoglutarate decarboxylase/oxoglutarate dehydrogenase thiamine pyrophosphate-binding subunit/dihydrolipoyllysine-residue succinyltransferase subunit [Corynebacterium tuscaniense]
MSSESTFGQNDWLVDEMFQQYKKDPNSVDAEWRDLFEKKGVTGGSSPLASGATGDTDKAVHRARTEAKVAKSTGAPSQDGRQTKVDKAVAESTTPSARKQPQAPKPSPLDKIGTLPEAGEQQLKGMFKAIAKNMDESLTVPTATTVRDMPVKLMFENRAQINDHLKRTRGGKISFTHIIGWAIVKSALLHPGMNVNYKVVDGKPFVVTPEHINLGLAIDLPQKDGSRALVVAAIKECETLTFDQFVKAYEDIVARARQNKLKLDDFQGVTIQLTNPGGIGTRHSIPRLTKGQGTIVGVGAMDYPAEFAGASEDRLAELGVGKLTTLTSTYDHRVIQGAESGEFLRDISQLLIDDKFWDEIFEAMQIPYAPMRWAQDIPNSGVDKSTRVMNLIEAYRSRGHLMADTNPLNWHQPGLPKPDARDLLLETHGLTLWDLDRTFNVGGFGGKETMTLREVLTRLRAAYTLHVGAEYTHVLDRDERDWLRDRLEVGMPKPTNAEQKYILQKLNAAEAFENFLQTKYLGQKRFSLEGAETLIPLMDSIIDTAAGQGLDEVVIGMPHRGRLNVLFNIMGKPVKTIFSEFEGNLQPAQQGGSGDVKYHLGFEGEHIQMFGDGEIKLTLAANPSHLEAVDPVLVGLARAKQDLINHGKNADDHTVVPLMLHGDASFAGLGVVQETLNMSKLTGYDVGGTVHIVVNNQVGFTTTPDQGRSTYYATDLAKGFDCPVFHVNGDDPEAAAWVGQLATEYRREFGKDVFIDLICYRLRGHNEADDPSVTQPLMYERIESHPSVRTRYTKDLIGRGDITQEEAEIAAQDFHDQLDSVFNDVKEGGGKPGEQTGITESQSLTRGLDTSIDAQTFKALADAYAHLPEDFTPNKRLKSVLKNRGGSFESGNIDWAWAELLAFGSLAKQGKLVRLAGEDSKRGTFTQRHGVLFDPNTGEQFNPLDATAIDAGNGGRFRIYNSALTEFGGLGFEYGYTVGNPEALVAWEAQFGDFANGGQTIIDEYISSGETKWGQLSKLVMLLPHGYEGQGPDHSSARIERFLQLVAEGSMTIAQPTIPANYFHLLRRQALGDMKRPLVVFTPKSMLRNKAAVSQVDEFTEQKSFRSVIDDPRLVDASNTVIGDANKVTTIMLCSGKIYYELEKRRAKDNREDIAIIRVEMLHPIPFNRLSDAFANYPNAKEIRFVQDEPANQGPWPFYNEHLANFVDNMPPMRRISRRAQSTTATGVTKVHQQEEKALLDEAFAD